MKKGVSSFQTCSTTYLVCKLGDLTLDPQNEPTGINGIASKGYATYSTLNGPGAIHIS